MSLRPPAVGAGPGASVFSKVQETALEALAGKESCVAKGYYHDRFLRLLRPPAAAVRRPPPMSPLIRRGASLVSSRLGSSVPFSRTTSPLYAVH